MPRYSYNPNAITENGVDRLRFELGDTTFNPAELTAALSDEEYQAVLDMNRHWKGPVSYDFSSRVEVWKDLYNRLKNEASISVPPVSGNDYGQVRPPYFYEDMHSNSRKGE